MKVAVVLALLVVACAAGTVDRREKRFIESIGHIFHEAVDAVTHTFNQAKSSFEHLTAGLNINFDSVVQAMIPLIDSGMTESACTTACVASAASVLGPAAPLAGTVCGPVCKAALAKLEETAG